MSKSPLSPFWSRNPNIPIYLDNGNERDHVFRTYEPNSRHHSNRYITVTSPSPPSYRSNPSPTPPSRNLAVPTLNVETSHHWSRPQPPLPALRFDVQSNAEGRPRVRSRKIAFSPLSPETVMTDISLNRKSYSSGFSIPNTPEDDVQHCKKTKLGLGIPDAPFAPDTSPIRSPRVEKLAKAEKGDVPKKKPSPNIAQGIEQKLWKYSASNNFVKRWLLEIISWVLSALCMSAIIVPLYLLQNKPVPSRLPLNLTLNSYVAILSRVASAALVLPVSEALGQLKWLWFQGDSKKMWDFELFDNASRGPWGSFMLLVRTKGTALAALGAAITIFAMALDPFFQQVVATSQQWGPYPQNSTVPRVIRYEPHFTRERRLGAEIMNPDRDISAIADKFFFDFGVPDFKFGNGTRADIPLGCPTSNCTWEPYETLGVCSDCKDVADMLDFGCLPAKLDWVQNATSFTPYENGTMCGWFFNATSEDRMLMLGYQVNPDTNRSSGEILTTRALPLITNINRRSLFGGSINFKNVRNPLADFVIVSTSDGPDNDKVLDSIFRHEKPRAFECLLSWCVQTINSSYFEASYTETITHRSINTTAGPYPWTFTAFDGPDAQGKKKVQYLQNITVQGNTSSYGASNETAFNIITIFDDYLPSFATVENNFSKPYLKYQTWEEDPYLREYPKNPWSAPNNITHHVERLALTMTNIMRRSSPSTATGLAFSSATYVKVRWLWLSLPVGLLTATLIFLIATVIRTSTQKDRVGVWKNSSIATLLYGLPEEVQRKITQMKGVGTPRTKARELNVRMLGTRGWRVSGDVLGPVGREKGPPTWF